ncbi:glycosyltransferase [Pajaroellobacter abortibovis]|nr:glycosyltransferase [Pajaroellobacter abortibovis]
MAWEPAQGNANDQEQMSPRQELVRQLITCGVEVKVVKVSSTERYGGLGFLKGLWLSFQLKNRGYDILVGDERCWKCILPLFFLLRKRSICLLWVDYPECWQIKKKLHKFFMVNVLSATIACARSVITLSRGTSARLLIDHLAWQLHTFDPPTGWLPLVGTRKRSLCSAGVNLVAILSLGASGSVQVILEALKLIRSPDVVLRLVMWIPDAYSSREKQEVQRWVNQSDYLTQHVVWVNVYGGVPPERRRERLAIEIAHADVLVFGARHAQDIQWVMEAYRQGTPVLIPEIGMLPRIARDKRGALVASSERKKGVADLLHRFIQDSELRQKLYQEARTQREILWAQPSSTGEKLYTLFCQFQNQERAVNLPD